jgi:PAS domain S-box-containing protein
MMRRLAPRYFLAMGLSSMLVTLTLGASLLRLIPDGEALQRAQRATIAENLAVVAAMFIGNADDDPGALNQAFELLFPRQPDLQSMAVRRIDHSVVIKQGPHAEWDLPPSAASTDAQIQVPLWHDGARWGQLELRFTPLRRPGIWSVLDDPNLRLMAFLGLASFLAFSMYLGRMLRHLDPSQAIPGRVRSALDTLTEGLLVLDAKGQTVLANQSLAALMGVTPDALLGRQAAALPWANRLGQDLDKATLPWVVAAAQKQTCRNVLMYLQTPDQQRYTFRVNCSPILQADQVQGVLVSFQDVTELEAKEIALHAAKEEADTANRAKSDFLANMSHEIRTPMNAILGFTELLRRRGAALTGSPEQLRQLDTIHASGQHLLDLINDILDLSKVESGKIELEHTAFAAHAVIGDVIDILQVKAHEKRIALAMQLDGLLPEQIQGDAGRLRQILTNLIGNAIKFTAQGQVTIRMWLDQQQPSPQLCIDICDTGIGIPPERLDAIFEPFVQAEGSTTQRFGGTGLGLTISRRLARAMGGDITVSSIMGEGSTFHLRLSPGAVDRTALLPAHQLDTRRQRAKPERTTVWRFAAKHVLVVDDAIENRALLRVILEETGLRISEAENGQAALDFVAQERVDLILMDMQMPVMDGITATRRLREGGEQCPILALTANAMKGFEAEIDKAGFSGHHIKPINIDALMADLGHRLDGTPLSQASAQATALKTEPDPADNKPPVSSANKATAHAPMVSRLSRHPKLRNVVRQFIEQFPARQGALRHALSTQNLDELAELAHWLKGAGGSVGFDAYFDPAFHLETACKAGSIEQARACVDEIERLAARMVLDAPASPDAQEHA